MKPRPDDNAAGRIDSTAAAQRRSVDLPPTPADPREADAHATWEATIALGAGGTGPAGIASNVVELARFLPKQAEQKVCGPLSFGGLPLPKARLAGLPELDPTRAPCDREALIEAIEHFLAGTVPEPETRRVLATVLIVGIPLAAPLAVHLGHERWQAYSTSFATVACRQIERFGGQLWANTIDGIVAVFDSPARAVQCAGSIDSAASHFGFPVRSGIHAGELEIADHGLTGIAMQVAQRVFELGCSGEILVSGTVRDLVAGTPFEFEEVDQRMQTVADERWGLYRVLTEPAPAMPAPVVLRAAIRDRAAMVLSRREREVSSLVAEGKSNRQIAGELFIAQSTVERHVANILNKLGFHSRVQVAAWAVASGMVQG